MNFICERCDIDMQTVFYEGVAIQLCISCKAIFLSKKKLEIIKDAHEFEILEATHISCNHFEDSHHCPRCEVVMKKMRHGKIRSTMIDYCEDCGGIWLDKSELISIQFSYEIAENNQYMNQRLRA